jgi:hypothetical protein
MLRTKWGMYVPTKSDLNHQTTSIIIDSLSGSTITINYKMGDKFKFLVGAGLTIKNVIFDAVDSLI